MSQFDKRINVNTIIENQLPEFILSDFPNATEFFKQYYISQEFQGGPSDLINNFDQYLKVDNLVPEVVVGLTSISSAISTSDTTITVPSTKGFPSEYGLLKIDDEIISYTGITSTSFTGCIRGFSGITGYNVGVSSSLLEINQEKLKFEDTLAASHTSGSSLTNLSVLFVQEFYKKMKKTFLPGLENNDFKMYPPRIHVAEQYRQHIPGKTLSKSCRKSLQRPLRLVVGSWSLVHRIDFAGGLPPHALLFLEGVPAPETRDLLGGVCSPLMPA